MNHANNSEICCNSLIYMHSIYLLGVVGALDGTHIFVKVQKTNKIATQIDTADTQ